MNKIESYIQERTLILEKALVFHINNQIKKHFKTKEKFVEYYNNCNNKQFSKKLNNAFSVPLNIINNIIGTPRDENGKQKKVFQKVKDNLLSRGNIILLKHFHEHYTDSKKNYTTVDRYLINPDKINAVLFDDAKISNINSGYYTDLESRLIYRYILNPNKYLKDFKNMKKSVKNTKNTSTQIETTEEQTKDELEMKTIETEINETDTNSEPTMTTKPDTQLLDMLTMMNNKINSLIKDNIELKKELDEIKSSLQNHTVTKYEDKKEDITTPVEVKNVEDTDDTDDDINEDNTTKTIPKDLIKDRWGFKYDQIKADKPFNGKDYDTFRKELPKAHNLKKITYTDYLNFLTIIGVKQLPKYDDNQKSTSRVAEYFNAFFDCLVSRGYNMFGMTRMKDDTVQTISNEKTNSQTNSNIKTFSKKEYLTAFNRILDEEMNHNYNDNDEDIYNQLLNNGNN